MNGPKLQRDWVGLRVRLLKSTQNSLVRIPAGTTGVIDACHKGKVRFIGDPCKCCGVSVVITGMRVRDFGILTPPDEWPDTTGKGRNYRPGRRF